MKHKASIRHELYECSICKRKKETIYYCEKCFRLICEDCFVSYYVHSEDNHGTYIKVNKTICKECNKGE